MLQGLVSLPEWSVSYRSTSDVISGGSRHFVWGGARGAEVGTPRG